MSGCSLCPRRCRARPGGFCGAGGMPRVFRWGPHFGEEPPICGEKGSGAVFFSRCTMKCIYCQNAPWSWQGGGEDVTVAALSGILRQLAVEDGCCNWNLVSPTPYLPFIREAVRPLLDEGVRLPFVWNSSGFESVETLRDFRDLCDIALVDLRYSSDRTARAASAAPGYVAASRAAVKHLWNALGPLDSEEPGRATRGVIVRLLVLPGHAEEAVENLAWLAAECSSDVHISVMSQYTPAYMARNVPPFDRGVTEEEYDTVTEAAADFGFSHGWMQGWESRDADLALLGEAMPPGHGPVRG
ncbi:MAG: 4Fe-4S cluster-binding domain-containing protein [Kiritimatiellae bacterium]|nr:4Fe-4S cluster-binding domain-containing protein [Kiritimatiellia bacterium]